MEDLRAGLCEILEGVQSLRVSFPRDEHDDGFHHGPLVRDLFPVGGDQALFLELVEIEFGGEDRDLHRRPAQYLVLERPRSRERRGHVHLFSELLLVIFLEGREDLPNRRVLRHATGLDGDLHRLCKCIAR